MGLTVNRQTVKKITVNRQKRKILTVNRQLIQAKLAVKGLEYVLSRTNMASNNGVKQTITVIYSYWNFSQLILLHFNKYRQAVCVTTHKGSWVKM